MTRRVAVTGLGCVSGLGQGVTATWAAARDGRGAIRTLSRPSDEDPAWGFQGPAAPIDSLDVGLAETRFGPRALGQLDPLAAFAVTATLEALSDAGILGAAGQPDDPVLRERTAVVYGCGSPGNATIDAAYQRLYARRSAKAHPQTIPKSMISAPASQISMLFGLHGPAFVIASACASSNHAIGEAMHMIRAGRAEVAITGGAEACLTPGCWAGWTAIRAMAPDTCRPFSTGRLGMALGEGAATLVLEDLDRARARGARIHGELIGYGATSDAANLTAPDLDGVCAAISAAHRDAGRDPAEPSLISSHGTGTPLNDLTETAAIRRVQGGGLDDSLVIATKSAHGHLIGGSGALELLLGLLALKNGVAPPILNHLGPDPACDLPLALAPTPIDYETLVSNSFAFGGLNAVLIARRL